MMSKTNLSSFSFSKLSTCLVLFLFVAFSANCQKSSAPESEVAKQKKDITVQPYLVGCKNKDAQSTKSCSNQKLMAFISENLKYPKAAMEKNIEGKALISFIINSKGLVENVKILENPGQGCGEEAARVVALMNSKGMKWVPGQKDGKPVAVDFKLPFQFKLPQ